MDIIREEPKLIYRHSARFKALSLTLAVFGMAVCAVYITLAWRTGNYWGMITSSILLILLPGVALDSLAYEIRLFTDHLEVQRSTLLGKKVSYIDYSNVGQILCTFIPTQEIKTRYRESKQCPWKPHVFWSTLQPRVQGWKLHFFTKTGSKIGSVIYKESPLAEPVAEPEDYFELLDLFVDRGIPLVEAR